MTTWEEIRDEIAGMLADGKPLEDVISKLDEMNKPKPMTNEEWFCNLSTKEKAKVIVNIHNLANIKQIEWWLKEIHQ